MGTLRNRKFLKEHTRREIESKIAENVERGWKQISDIKSDYGNYQVLMELVVCREVEKV